MNPNPLRPVCGLLLGFALASCSSDCGKWIGPGHSAIIEFPDSSSFRAGADIEVVIDGHTAFSGPIDELNPTDHSLVIPPLYLLDSTMQQSDVTYEVIYGETVYSGESSVQQETISVGPGTCQDVATIRIVLENQE